MDTRYPFSDWEPGRSVVLLSNEERPKFPQKSQPIGGNSSLYFLFRLNFTVGHENFQSFLSFIDFFSNTFFWENTGGINTGAYMTSSGKIGVFLIFKIFIKFLVNQLINSPNFPKNGGCETYFAEGYEASTKPSITVM
jgi:hypothetical protein